MQVVSYPPDEVLPTGTVFPEAALQLPAVSVCDETALEAARRLTVQRLLQKPVVLNFASARNPGGGWRLDGVSGQEEALCRATHLGEYLSSAAAAPMYAHHRTCGPLNSDWLLYTPDVLVRAGGWHCSFISCAAPNARDALRGDMYDIRRAYPASVADDELLARVLPRVLEARAARVLAVAALHSHRDIVLGAWGCGHFGNDPYVVARAFLGSASIRAFDSAVFAVPDARYVREAIQCAINDWRDEKRADL